MVAAVGGLPDDCATEIGAEPGGHAAWARAAAVGVTDYLGPVSTTQPAPPTGPAPDLLEPYDAVVVLSFGGPESPEEVMPFMRRVTAGRGIPEDRLVEVASHYFSRDGVSPINGQNRALVAALQAALTELAPPRPVRLANRNSEPFLPDVLAGLHAEGARRVVVVTTSGYSSYSSCRQYRENLADAADGLSGLLVDKVEPWFGHPGFVDTMAAATLAVIASGLRGPVAQAAVLCVTHSIPDAMDETSGPGDEDGRAYSRQHVAVAARILDRVRADSSEELRGELVFCSRSGPPRQPWLEPDVGDRIRELADEGVTEVVLVPIGFASDHMEVVNDLDTVAVAIGRDLGLTMHRVPTVGTAAEFVAGLVDLLVARAARARGEDVRAQWALDVPHPDPVCPAGCCPNLREARPALCGLAP